MATQLIGARFVDEREQMMAQTMEQEGQTEQGRVQARMVPRAAAAAEPHKRRAVVAGTAVGAAVGEGG
eukprot:7109902-Prymnesium_polylepis.1